MIKHKLISLFVALVSAANLLAYDAYIDGIYYNLNSTDMTAEVTNETGYPSAKSYSGSITIPASVSYSGKTYSVTTIGYRAFYDCRGLTSITIPNSVTTIGYEAFFGCTGLTSVTIGNSVTTIGERAFAYCSGLASVTIPNSVTTIGGGAFNYVNNIVYNGTAIAAPWGAKCMNGYIEGYLVYSDVTKTTLCGCSSAAKGEIIVPNSVTTIGEYAFYSCSGLTSVTIPNSVTTIEGGAFRGCSGLTSVTIPNSVTTIGSDAFNGCSGLTSVTIPNSVTTIGRYAFCGCSGLTSETIPNSVTTIGEGAFYNCSGLTSVTIPNSVTTIGDYAFFGCTGLTSVTIGNSVTTIGERAFAYCSGLTSVTIPNSVTTIGDYAFYDCSGLTSITIPNSVTTIGYAAFCDCRALTSVTIPNSVTTIGSSAFVGCSGLTSVTIPNSVTTIGDYAFYDCSGLTSVTCYATTPPTCGSDCFYNVKKSIPVYVPARSVDDYKQAEEWKAFTNILPIGAEEVPATDPIITPDNNSVTITWPQTENADTYTLEIRKNGELVCTLTFNNQGVMIDITFAAPARNESRTASAAEMTVNGYKFTITGLEQGTEYTYAVIAKDASAQPLQTYSGSFKTTDPTGLEDLTIDKKVGTKFIYGNQLYIRHNGHLHTATGAKVK